MKVSVWKVIVAYGKGRRKEILLFCIILLFFFVLFWLRDLPMEAYLYGVLLSVTAALLFLLYDFNKFYQKHKALLALCEGDIAALDKMPAPGDLLQRDYQELVDALQRQTVQLTSQADRRYSEMLDYYTLWVHQAKTPIAAMQALMQTGGTGENLNLPAFEQELFKIERYVEMALQYMRLESPSGDFVFKEHPMAGLVKQAVKKYAPVFIFKKIRLEFDEMPDTVITDEKWAVFILEQILSNALKYTKTGKISICMDEGEEKALLVEDTGIGIKGEDLPRIFEKGFTGYNGRLFKKSTGLGLYLCKQVMDKLGGEITADSIVGKGTKVRVAFRGERTLWD